MSNMRWTDEQLLAIRQRNTDTLVSAAAGSGKTAVLVERVIRMLTDTETPVDVDRLLVVTFTNAAAEQMKEKISASISQAIEKDPGNMHLRSQLIKLGSAEINTVHSFCMNVIRDNFQETDLPYEFNIVNDTERHMLMEDALDETFCEFYENPETAENFERFVDGFSGKDDSSASELCLRIYEFLRSMPFYRKWVENAAKNLDFTSPSDTLWGKALLSYAEMMVGCAEDLNNWLVSYIDENGESLGVDVYRNGILGDRDIINNMKSVLNGGIDAVYNYLEDLKFPAIGRKKAETDPESGEFIKTVRDQVKGIFKKLKEDVFFQSEEEICRIVSLSKPAILILADVILEFDIRYSEKKKKKGVVDFSDLEHKCAEILARVLPDGEILPSDVALRLREKYCEVLVDEYQDTNNLQELIISLVSGERKRFMVGDVKQSIYGFRNSKPELFIDKYENYARDDGFKNRRLVLSKNFRSSESVLSFVNFVFSKLMCRDCGGLDYKDDEKLYFGGGYEKTDTTEVCIFDTADFADADKKEVEAEFCASRIRQMVDSGYVIEAEGEQRPARFGDFTLLLRTVSSNTDIYRKAFAKYDIPLYVEGSSSYFDSPGIKLAVSLLRIIDNPRQDIDLIAVLRSHIFGFDDDMLVSVRLKDKKADFYTCLKLASDDGFPHAVRFFEFLAHFRSISKTSSVRTLTEALFDECSMYSVFPESADKLRALTDWAEKYGKTSYKGLFSFITFLKRQIEDNIDIGGNTNIPKDCVTLMSIHRSKGLENSIVILSNAGGEFNLTDTHSSIMFDDELGLWGDYADTKNRIIYAGMPKVAMALKLISSSVSEEMRLLYVALTRAKFKLVVVGSVKNLENQILKLKSMAVAGNKDGFLAFSAFKARSYLDWILSSLLFHPDCRLLHQYGIDIFEKNSCDFSVDFRLNPEILPYEKKSFVPKEQMDTYEDYESIRKILEYTYPDSVATTIPSKLSVSEMKSRFYAEITDDETVFYPRTSESVINLTPEPAFLSRDGKLSPSELGVAYHSVLQYMDFTSGEDISVILDGLKNQGVLTEAEMSAIDEAVIARFLKSSLCRDIVRADKVYKEYSFIMPFDSSKLFGGNSETIMVQGIIDCLYKADGEYYVVDYKSDYYSSAAEIADRYRVQLAVYVDAVEKKIGKRPVKCMLYMLRTGEIILF